MSRSSDSPSRTASAFRHNGWFPRAVVILPHQYPAQGGRVASASFPIFRAYARGLTAELGALIAMSDLQGREPDWNMRVSQRRLLGELLAEELQVLSELGEVPSADTIGVVVGGDVFVAQDLGKRGGKGDVREIWRCFRVRFRWVAGTPGNHDRFGEGVVPPDEFLSAPGIHYLDLGVVAIDGIRVGGLGGVIGNPSRPFRREECTFLESLEHVAVQAPDIIILHEGPAGRTTNRNGNEAIRDLLERLPKTLVLCGHSHWDGHEQEELANGTQVLNADARAYLILSEIG